MGEVETKVTKEPKKKRLPLFILLGAAVAAAAAAAIILLGNGGGSGDKWLREALADESTRTIELNEDIKATEGYEVNGTKTIVGTGKISMTEGSNYVFSVNDGASLTVDGITLNVKNIGNNGVVVRAGGKLEWKSGTISYPKQYAIINYGETTISGGTFEYAGANWLYVKADTTANVTGGYFVKSGAAGFEVEQGARLNISGKDTLMERAGTNTINNNGTVVMTGGTIAQSEVWTITNHGELTMENVTVKDCALKGVLYNYADCVSASISNCNFSNSKTYHIYNKKEVTIKDTVMVDSGASPLNNQIGATMNLENVSVTNGGYHCIYNDRGTVNIKNCAIDTTVYKGVQNKSGFVTIDGLTLDNIGGAALGNVAYVAGAEYGYIHANNVTVTNSVGYNLVSYGGEVILSNSTLNITPSANVYIRNGKATLDNVKILGTSTEGKAALNVGSDTYRTAEVTIKGDTVIKDSASRGVTNYGTLYMYDGTITGNRPSATKKAGGGVYTLGDFYMYGGSITGNSAVTYGGGVRVDADEKSTGNFYMYGGSVSNNTADSNGGGVSIAKPQCSFVFDGGAVANNVSGGKGDGILLNGKMQLGSGAVIKNNDLYIFDDGLFVNVSDSSLSGAPIQVRHGGLTEGSIIAKFSSESVAKKLAGHFVSANNQFEFVVDGKNLVAKISMSDLTSPVDFSDAPTVTVSSFAQLKQAVESTSGEKIIKIAANIPMTGTITVPNGASVKLIDDGKARILTRSGHSGALFELENKANLYVAGKSGLTLDGNSLKGTKAKMPLIFARTEAYVVLQNGAVLQNNTNTSYATSACGGAVNLYGGRMILEGGTITNCNGPSYADGSKEMTNRPAVYVSTSGVLSIKDGVIENSQNGAVRSYGRLYISGGEIRNNVRNGDGGAAIRACWLNMTGGTISGNKTTNAGSAVYLTPSETYTEGYFYMDGGTITGNVTGVNESDPAYNFDTVGGAVYVAQDCVFDFVSGTISENQAIGTAAKGMNGGAVVNDGTTYLRSGAVVKDNYATRNAGGIYCRNKAANLVVEGATISGNSTDGRGGAIFTEGADNTVTITGATIENNKAIGAGAILFGGGVGTVTDTTFTGNVAERVADERGNGGAILNQSRTKLTLNNVTFDGNKAIAKDGGGGCGGAVYVDGATLTTNGVIARNNEARVADDIFYSANVVSTTAGGAFDVTEIYLEGSVVLKIGENFSGRSDSGLILVDLPSGSSTSRYVSGEQILSGKVDAACAALFTLGEEYPTLNISENGIIYADGEDPGDLPVVPTVTVAKIGETEYTSLAEAIDAAKDGDTILIVADIQQKSLLTIDKAITIATDGNGDRTITSGATSGFLFTVNANVNFSGSEGSRLILDGAQKGSSLLKVSAGEETDVSTIEYVTFQNAKNGNQGGAIQVPSGAGTVKFTNCVVQNNETSRSANAGAGIFVGGGRQVEMEDCQLLNNKTTVADGTGGHGGAIMLSTTSGMTGKIKLTNCRVEGNSATGYGSIVYGTQTGGTPTEFVATDCQFINNSYEGSEQSENGAIRVTGMYVLTNNTFSGNYGYTIYDNSTRDFSTKSTTGTSSVADGNTFDKAKADAIWQNESSRADVKDNNIFRVIVAEVDGVQYETLQAAVNAAADDAVIVLKDDVAENITVPAGKSVTFTGGCTITGDAVVEGTMNLGDAQIKGSVTVNGTLGLEGDSAVTEGKVTLGDTGVIAVTGTLTAEPAATVTSVTEGKTILTGSEADLAANKGKFVLDTTDSSLALGEDGKVVKLAYVAMIGSKTYESLSAALAEAVDGDTIKLGADVDLTDIIIDKSVTLTADSAVALSNTAELAAGVTVTVGDNVTGGVFQAADDTASVSGGSYTKLATGEEICYVELAEGTEAFNRTTLTSYATLSEAVEAAQSGETLVLTAETYTLSDTLTISKKNVTILTDGNGTKTIKTDNTANYGVNLSGASGAIATMAIKGTADSPIVIDGLGKERARAVVLHNYANVTMEYVTIRGGASTEAYGGGLHVTQSGTGKSVLNNCILEENTAQNSGSGAAVYVTSTGKLEMNNCIVRNNTHTNTMSIIQIAQSSGSKPGQVIANNCTFTGNRIEATEKKASSSVIRCNGGFTLTNCAFSDNLAAIQATEADPVTYADIYAVSEGNATTAAGYERSVTNCVFDTAENVAIGNQSDSLYSGRIVLIGNIYNAGREGSTTLLSALPAMVDGAELMGYTDGASAEEATYRFADADAVNAAYTAYAAQLEENGYALYSENAIGGNSFATYTKAGGSQSVAVTVMATPGSQTLRLIAEQDAALFALAAPESGSVEPSVTMLGVGDPAHTNADGDNDQRNGMNFIYQLNDGSFVIVDGGYNSPADAKRIYDLLQEKKTGDKPVISAWILTHSHVDHVGAFVNFAANADYVSAVELKSIVLNFPAVASYAEDSSANTYYREAVLAAIPALDGAAVYHPHPGDVMHLAGAQIEFLYTYELAAPSALWNLNDSSLVFTVEINGQKTLMTGDAACAAAETMLANYTAAELSCDALQVCHHGYHNNIVPTAFYEAVLGDATVEFPKLAFWPSCDERYMDNYASNAAAAANAWLAEQKAAGKLVIEVAGDQTADPIAYHIKTTGLEFILPPSVAEVNGTSYASVAEALAAAGDGGTVKLLANQTELAVNQSVTLLADEAVTVGSITVAEGKALDLDGAVSAANITLGSGATIVLDDENAPESNVIVADAAALAAAQTPIATGSEVVDNYEKLTIIDQADNATKYMAYCTSADATEVILVEKGEAKIGETTYASFVDAVAAAQTGAQTVTVISDVALTAQLKITDSMNIKTDGVKDRTITTNVTGANWGIIFTCVKGEDTAEIKGTKDSMLIIEYTGTGATKGLLCSERVDSTLEYVKILNGNRTDGNGAGLYVTNGTCVATNCEISGNKAAGNGGGVYVTGTGKCEMINCILTGNSAKNGGALYMAGGDNTSRMINCTVTDNSASASGGVCHVPTNGKLTVQGGTFSGNSAANGGALSVAQSNPDYGELTIGGYDNNGTVVNAVFENNSASASGNDIYATGKVVLSFADFINSIASTFDIVTGVNSGGYGSSISSCTFDRPQSEAISDGSETQIPVTDCIFAAE